MTGTEWVNWAGNQRDAAVVRRPGSTDEVAALVKQARADGRTVKPAGAGHSFTAAASTGGVRLHLDRLTGPVSVDAERRPVTAPAGVPPAPPKPRPPQPRVGPPNPLDNIPPDIPRAD